MLGVMFPGRSNVYDYVTERYRVDVDTGRFWKCGVCRRINLGYRSPIGAIEVPCDDAGLTPSYKQTTYIAPATYITG